MLNLHEHFPPQNGKLVTVRVSRELLLCESLHPSGSFSSALDDISAKMQLQLRKVYILMLLPPSLSDKTNFYCWWRERSESHICPLALYHFLNSERLFIHRSHLTGINFHICIKRMMHFDLFKHFPKVCEAATALGVRYPTVTKTRVILVPSVGLSCPA